MGDKKNARWVPVEFRGGKDVLQLWDSEEMTFDLGCES